MEKVLWLIECVKSGLRGFMLEIGFSLDDAPWLGRPVEVDSHEIETLIENKSVLSHAGDSQHTKNIQINKVIGENEKCVFYFMEKTLQTFWPAQHIFNSFSDI